MTNTQRMKSDIATIDRRETADKTMRDNRIKNDELTIERRSKADKTVDEHRLKNDETTANRREVKDRNPSMNLALFLLLLTLLVVGAFIFI